MAKKLALVVHGIGEQQEGETVYNLVGGLTGDSAVRVETERRELIERERDGVGELFPCHIARVREGGDETVFAEVYWADLSGGQGGALRNALELIKLGLGLGHVVRRNVRTYHKSGWRKKLAEGIVYLLHGPIAGINAVLLAGFLLSTIGFFAARPHLVAWLVGASGIAVGLLGIKLATNRHYYRIFSQWLTGLGAGSIAFSIFTVAFNSTGAYPAFGFVEACTAGAGNTCLLPWLALPFVVVLNIVALVAILGTMALILVEAVTSRDGPSDRHKIYDATLALMILMWLVIASVIWSSLFPALRNPVPGQPDQTALLGLVSSSTMLMGPLFLGLFAIAGAVGVVMWRISKWVAQYPQALDQDKPRLMVNPIIQYALMAVVVVLGIIGGEIVWKQFGSGMSIFRAFVDELYVVGVIGAVVLAALYSTFSELVGSGIAVIKDIVAYLKQEPASATANRAQGELQEPLRDRMKARLATVARVMNAGEAPAEIVVVSHSLGTMIATDGLVDEAIWPQLVASSGRKPTLVTMGSPYSHIFTHHFEGFEAPETFENRVSRWLNIHRADDFVGTTIDMPNSKWFENRRVGPRGHTGYWSDIEVTPILRKEIFAELPQPLQKAA